jgi:hypothetical protein
MKPSHLMIDIGKELMTSSCQDPQIGWQLRYAKSSFVQSVSHIIKYLYSENGIYPGSPSGSA